jgi:triacylglycerol esterase/lipase EstA (alpha/beta hydrolase family)
MEVQLSKAEDGGREGVVLLHGIMRTSRSLSGLSAHLSKEGFEVLNLDYPSTRLSLAELAEDIHGAVSSFAARIGRVHFVGFSMGGLVIRAYLKAHRPDNLGRVVMIGTPNNGSEVADLLKENRLFASVLGPAGQQLVTDQSAFRHLFDDIGYELGIIAGRNIANPLASIIFKAPNDGKVSVASTLLPGCRDHIVIRRNHTLIGQSRRSHSETAIFLRTGRFSADSVRSGLLSQETT